MTALAVFAAAASGLAVFAWGYTREWQNLAPRPRSLEAQLLDEKS
ncbi:hypothetical protein RHODO2019_10970 [Rhodococcus antarcticus]|uniref:Uncharacterized protein n=1 Tax=Rhodococcus antarcticus TaxID=2987751 RepID=A0ABY6NWG8_9NOCA|nr:hypothetical protein [Rhodococcus antarcticus]UZJ23727.1 hypothetical protein RHODO2019_10970 [Rhodococcus antarcticus]